MYINEDHDWFISFLAIGPWCGSNMASIAVTVEEAVKGRLTNVAQSQSSTNNSLGPL